MGKYIGKRLLQFVAILFLVSVVCFLINFITPIDTAKRALGDPMTHALPDEEILERFREVNGLNRPVHIQYLEWLNNLLHGNLGNSLITGEPVGEDLAMHFFMTFKLAGFSIILTLLLALPLGILCALKQNRLPDVIGRILAVSAVSMPAFWLAYLLIIGLALKAKLLPVAGYGDGSLKYMILPGLALSMMSFGTIMKMMRTTMIDVLKQDYMLTAEAKGLSKFRTVFKHGFRNAMIPVSTIAGMTFASMLAGSAVIEEIFAWPGIGHMILEGIENKDFPVVQACVISVSAIYLIINLAVDILYAFLNPRIRYD